MPTLSGNNLFIGEENGHFVKRAMTPLGVLLPARALACGACFAEIM